MAKRKSLASALKHQQAAEKRVKVTTKKQQRGQQSSSSSLSIQPCDKNGDHSSRADKSRLPSIIPSGRPPLIPFCATDRILLVGEGNFSFAASCVENHLEHAENVVATSLDDKATLLKKYPEAEAHLETIVDACGTVRHGVDATKLHEHFRGHGDTQKLFDVCVFVFPHVGAGIADEARNVLSNQKMLLAFFESVQSVMATDGTIAVALATNKTYDMWNLKGLAKSQGLVVKTSGAFDGRIFPKYEHRRTHGNVANDAGFSGGKGEERSARWTIFQKKSESPAGTPSQSKNAANRKGYDSEDDDD